MINADSFATIRVFHGMSQRELADLLEVSQPYIAQVESKSRPVSDNLRNKMMTALELTPDKIDVILGAARVYEDVRQSFIN